MRSSYRKTGETYSLQTRLDYQRKLFEQQSAEEYEPYNAQSQKRMAFLDKIRGSLFGGAVGDALGYPVEFASLV